MGGPSWDYTGNYIHRDWGLAMIKKIQFKNGKGLILHGFISEPKKYETAIIFLHGFPSSCQGFTASRILTAAAKTNYLMLIFSFSHTPPSEGKFEDKLMSKEVDDIKYAIDFLDKNYKYQQLVLIGHSTGAIDASLYAYRDKRIQKLILMGAESDTRHSVRYDFTDQQVRDFWTKGKIIYNAPGKWYHRKKLKRAFYDEFFTLNIPGAIKRYKRPLLIIHGENDEAVPFFNAKELFALANKPKKLAIIKGSDHRFSHPKHFKRLLSEIIRFIEQ